MARRTPLWRALLCGLLLMLFCLSAPVALLAGWARMTAGDAGAYARVARAVAGDPRVQAGLGQAVAARAEVELAGENPTATDAVQARVVATAIGDAARRLAGTAQFLDTWQAANRAAYEAIVSGLATGQGEPLVLDLSPLAGALQAELAASDLDLPPNFAPAPADLRFELLSAPAADRLRRALARLDLAFWLSLGAAVLALLLSVSLARDRLAALGRAGLGLTVAMALLIALLIVAQRWAVSTGASDQAVLGSLVDAGTQSLRLAAVGLALLGLVLAGVFTGLSGLRRSMVRGARAADPSV